MSDDERPKRSWREIDRRKDRSAHRQEDRRDQEGRGPRGQRRERSYKAALDRLFESGKIAELVEQKGGGGGEAQGENRIKALARIKNAGNRDEVTAAVDEYLKGWNELPDDMEVLGRALEHRNPTWQLDAMERIERLLETERPRRTRAMVGQLKMIRDIGDDNEMVELAQRLIDRLE
jgi:hypothetical protein